MTRVLVFTRMKHVANRVSEELERYGVSSAAIHGNKSQNARQKALDSFKGGGVRVLVATDIAARGIDVDGVSHVINYELPDEPEAYVHRIGRTARAGASGVALSFCSPEERGALRDIERVIRAQVPVVPDHPFAGVAAPAGQDSDRPRPPHGRGRGGGGGSRGGSRGGGGGGGGGRFGRRR
jgi:ATP-dependent RNA helicase RhlE